MCLRIAVVDSSFELVFWNSSDVLITVRRGTPPEDALTEITAILQDLSAPPASPMRLRCFCGEAISVPEELLAPLAAQAS